MSLCKGPKHAIYFGTWKKSLGFPVFSFSGFLVPLAASFWPGRVFYVLSVFRCFQNVVAGLNLCSSLEVPNFPTHQTVGVWNVVVHICLQRPALGIASISRLSGISCRENRLPTCFANYLGNSTGPDTTKSAMLWYLRSNLPKCFGTVLPYCRFLDFVSATRLWKQLEAQVSYSSMKYGAL